MKTRNSLLAAMLLLAAACSTVNYESPEFANRAQHHQIIAVLPFEMVFTGDPPDNLSAEQIAQIEEAGSSPDVFTGGTCGAESGGIPVTAISPAIFVKQIETQRKMKSQERPPILPRPDEDPVRKGQN